ncbi:hypothetical protein L1F30_02005 [Simiduia sp. 21SJ11W-1]|uniref:hypothetical protein n=1 Tax=Simiduia sp. 21SJ11W-1 TaxID=2909669 RepID=UPI0020A15DA4|nr:hypothetical protein [Simiduia sp. 21SJ11W-1]UTA48329.1 hypothetical protein L1F30_02005 [Simiduia sp. 21SJ11W-1]
MNRAIFILSIPLLLAAVSRAWWVDYVYEPLSETEKYGSEFSAVEIYTCESDRYFTHEQCKGIQINGGKFSVVSDLNNDGVKELWSVGVARYKSGKYPYANVVVVSDPVSKTIQQVLTVELKSPGFAIFFGKENELSLFFCMECGSYADIQWKNNKWALVWPEPYG